MPGRHPSAPPALAGLTWLIWLTWPTWLAWLTLLAWLPRLRWLGFPGEAGSAGWPRKK